MTTGDSGPRGPHGGPQALLFLAALYLQPLLCSLTGRHRAIRPCFSGRSHGSLPHIREVLAELPCSEFPSLPYIGTCFPPSGLSFSNPASSEWPEGSPNPASSERPEGSRWSLFACLVSGLGPPALGAAAPARAVPASSRPGVAVPVRGPGLRSTFAPASALSARPRAAPLVPLLQLPHPGPPASLPQP